MVGCKQPNCSQGKCRGWCGIKKCFKRLFFILFVIGFFLNGYKAIITIYDHSSGRETYDFVREKAYREWPVSESEKTSEELKEQDVPEDNSGQKNVASYLPTIDENTLSSINEEYAAWLLIPNTKVSYPVVYPENNEAYLAETFDGKKKSCGCLFFDAYKEPLSGRNTIIHGHNMKSGDMFGGLKKFLSKDYAEQHPFLYLHRRGKWTEYHLLSVYIVSNDDNTPYETDFKNENEYKTYLKEIKSKNIFKTSAEIGDEDLLTLSTCHGKEEKLILQFVMEKEGAKIKR